jgi:hypothetical protein
MLDNGLIMPLTGCPQLKQYAPSNSAPQLEQTTFTTGGAGAGVGAAVSSTFVIAQL